MNTVDKLGSIYLFKDVPRRSLEEFIVHSPPVQFPRGSEVFRQGTSADVALLLIEGRLVAQVEGNNPPKGRGSDCLAGPRPRRVDSPKSRYDNSKASFHWKPKRK